MKTSISNPAINLQQAKKAEASRPPARPAPPRRESILLAPTQITDPLNFNRGF
jgi:hypothetical protein